MKKNGLKAILFIMIFTMIFAGSAFAQTSANHVSQAANGKGDALIFPVYFTTDGWETKLIVTNTSLTESVVAKVIIRSKENSQELRDFMIFLSPADVWTGTLYNDGSTTYITSTDDSCLNSATTFASVESPFTVYLEDACAGDTNEIGYVTVIQGGSFSVSPDAPGVDKDDIYTQWDTWFGFVQNPINVLTGHQEINNSIAGISYSLNATVLKNYNWDIATQLNTQFETFLGLGSDNSYGEVEAALSKDLVVVPYYAQAEGSVFGIYTFPTKFSSYANCTTRTLWTNQFNGFPTPTYTLTAYDLMENTVTPSGQFVSPQPAGEVNSFPSEVNFLSVTDLPGSFDEGWMLIDGTDYTTDTVTDSGAVFYYTGFPMIASSMRFNNQGNAGWLYNAYTPGTIDFVATTPGINTEERNYHFWSVDGEN